MTKCFFCHSSLSDCLWLYCLFDCCLLWWESFFSLESSKIISVDSFFSFFEWAATGFFLITFTQVIRDESFNSDLSVIDKILETLVSNQNSFFFE